VGDLVFVYHFVLLHFLDGHYFTSLYIPANADFTKRATTDDFQWFEIFNRNFCSPNE